MKVVYVAGPYIATSAWKREQNIRRAEEACLLLWRAGVPTICVHSIARYFFGEVSEADAIACDDELLERCDAVLLAPGWSESPGTRREIARAEARGMTVWSLAQIDELIAWAKSP